jgi:ribosomal-protein-alanine N-acetyltransferase
MRLSIRDANSRDIPKILEVERLSFSQPWSADSFSRELSLPFSRIIIGTVEAGRENRFAGFLCRWLVADECHILNIAVHPNFRRSGVAVTLISEAINEVKAKKAAVITLEVRRSNVAARSLYRKLLFQERRVRKNYYGAGEDAIIMERSTKS